MISSAAGDVIMLIHHTFPSQTPDIKEKRTDLKLIYILAIKGRTATIIQRYFFKLNQNNRFNFRQKLRHAYRQRRNVFSCNSVGWFIYRSERSISNIYVKGLTVWLKFIGKTNRSKNPIKVALFTISCISFIFLIGIGSFCTNFIKVYSSQRIDHFPHLRIHLWYKDCPIYPVQTRINSLCLFLLFLFMPLALLCQNDVRINA